MRVFMADLCKHLPWDSAHFGVRVARVEANRLTRETVSEIDAWLKANPMRAEAWFRERSIERVTVPTQAANIPALRLYESRGFKISKVEPWFHRWL